jgi:4-hydroxybenzoate polyprenyltransferase
VALYFGAMLWGRFLTHAGTLRLSARDVLGYFAAYGFLFMLRVFDEHKDYEKDLVNHPDRVLQRGLITLWHLKVGGAIAIAVQLGVSLYDDGGFGPVTARWLLVIVWSAMMAKEFWVGEWLEKRLVLYATSHMLVTPMAILWMMQMGAGEAPLPKVAYLVAALSFLSGASFEVARKVRGPEGERDGVDSYTKVLGPRGVTVVLLLLALGSGALLVPALLDIGGGTMPLPIAIAAALAVILPMATVLRFAMAPSQKLAKQNEATVGLHFLAVYSILVAALVLARGIAWS